MKMIRPFSGQCEKKEAFIDLKKNKDYEKINYVSNNGDSIYAAPIEDLPGGQAYYSLNVIREIIKEELDHRFGPCEKNMVDEDD